MATIEDLYRHVLRFHELSFKEFLLMLATNSSDVVAVHDSLHVEPQGHSHDANGDVVVDQKTVLGYDLIATNNGWALDATAVETMQALINFMNNNESYLTVFSANQDEGKFQTSDTLVNIEGENISFVEMVSLLLGETIIRKDEIING